MKCIVNPKNDHELCFFYAMAAGVYESKIDWNNFDRSVQKGYIPVYRDYYKKF